MNEENATQVDIEVAKECQCSSKGDDIICISADDNQFLTAISESISTALGSKTLGLLVIDYVVCADDGQRETKQLQIVSISGKSHLEDGTTGNKDLGTTLKKIKKAVGNLQRTSEEVVVAPCSRFRDELFETDRGPLVYEVNTESYERLLDIVVQRMDNSLVQLDRLTWQKAGDTDNRTWQEVENDTTVPESIRQAKKKEWNTILERVELDKAPILRNKETARFERADFLQQQIKVMRLQETVELNEQATRADLDSRLYPSRGHTMGEDKWSLCESWQTDTKNSLKDIRNKLESTQCEALLKIRKDSNLSRMRDKEREINKCVEAWKLDKERGLLAQKYGGGKYVLRSKSLDGMKHIFAACYVSRVTESKLEEKCPGLASNVEQFSFHWLLDDIYVDQVKVSGSTGYSFNLTVAFDPVWEQVLEKSGGDLDEETESMALDFWRKLMVLSISSVRTVLGIVGLDKTRWLVTCRERKQDIRNVLDLWRVTHMRELFVMVGGGRPRAEPALIVDSFFQCAEDNALIYLIKWLQEHNVKKNISKATWYTRGKRRDKTEGHKCLCDCCIVTIVPLFKALTHPCQPTEHGAQAG